MLPIIGQTGSGIQGTVFLQQLVWKNVISRFKLTLPPITSHVKRKVVVGHLLTHGFTFDTRGVIISFVNIHMSCYREIWMSSAHLNVLWSIGSSAIFFIQGTRDFSTIIFIDENVHFAHFDVHVLLATWMNRSQNSISHCGNILDMCSTVSDHTNRKVIIYSRWKIWSSSCARNSSSLTPTFEAILDGYPVFNICAQPEIPWFYRINIEDSGSSCVQSSRAP